MTRATIEELRDRLSTLEVERKEFQQRQEGLERQIAETLREEDALRIVIAGLTDETDNGAAVRADSGPQGPRPTIREIATGLARESGGIVRVRDLMKKTMEWGFKSDQGGLHTYLKGLDEFEQDGPGIFRLKQA